MPLFCKQCNNRRLPRWMTAEKMTLWICETCKNFVDAEDIIIRESEQLPHFSYFRLSVLDYIKQKEFRIYSRQFVMNNERHKKVLFHEVRSWQ